MWESEVKNTRKRTFVARNVLFGRLPDDLYINHFQFIYKSFSINIYIVNDLYIKRRPQKAFSGHDKKKTPVRFVTEPGGCRIG